MSPLSSLRKSGHWVRITPVSYLGAPTNSHLYLSSPAFYTPLPYSTISCCFWNLPPSVVPAPNYNVNLIYLLSLISLAYKHSDFLKMSTLMLGSTLNITFSLLSPQDKLLTYSHQLLFHHILIHSAWPLPPLRFSFLFFLKRETFSFKLIN